MVRTRFAPSPTGMPHIGHLRTCAYAYALAKHNKGDFILRIEDTDQKRYVSEALETIKRMITGFGMQWDEYYVQSERAKEGIYQKAAEKLVGKGKAFYCQCEAKNAKEQGFSNELRDPCRKKNLKSGAIKLLVPDNEEIAYSDFVLDKVVSWKTSEVADTTLLKSDGFPTYHLAVVVDDSDMRISHVLRGHDWMPSTPIHLLIYKALGLDLPQIGHLTDILDPKGGKLSKRKGSTSIEQLLKEGYVKEAIFNFTILLGWAPKDNRELFTLEEFVKAFDPKGFQKANPVFNRDKLDWFNKQYIAKQLNTAQFMKYASQASVWVEEPGFQDLCQSTAPLIQPRLTKFSEYDGYLRPLFEEPKVDKKLLGKTYQEHLKSAVSVLEGLEWEKAKIDEGLQQVVAEKHYQTGDFFMDLRIAVTGSRITMPINDLILRLGQTVTLKRLKQVIS